MGWRTSWRARAVPKVPRPRHEQADPAAQASWNKGGLVTALTLADGSAGQAAGRLDGMRLELVGARRRRWGIRSVKVIQPLGRRDAWSSLVLLVDGELGSLW